MEKCTNCGRDINNNEKAYVYQGNHVVCDKCYILLIEKAKQTKETRLSAEEIAGIWNIIGVVYGALTCLVVFVIGAKLINKVEYGEITWIGWLIILATPGLFILTGLIPFTISAIIRAINTNTLELRKLKEEIKINRKNEKSGAL